MPATDFTRFWSKVHKAEHGCWLWTASFRIGGYGNFMFRGKPHKAHRVSWILTHGEIPDGALVCHSCDTPACVRPDHLFLGTHQDNMQDMNAKGRHHRPSMMTMCKRGLHPFQPGSYYKNKNGTRLCKECWREYHAAYRLKAKAKKAAR
jgi:hypothetical protein